MMNLQEVLQSDFVILKPGMTKVIGLELPQERTDHDSAALEEVVVSLFYHGYTVVIDWQGETYNDHPMHLLIQREEDKGSCPSAQSVQQVMNGEWWEPNGKEVNS